MDAENGSEKLFDFQNIQDENLINILNRMTDSDKKACSEFMEKLRKDAEKLINEQRILSEQAKIEEMQTTLTEYNNSYIELRNLLINELFEKVVLKVVEYVETGDYSDFLINDIKKMLENFNEEINVYLCPRDMVFFEQLSQIHNVTILEGYDDYIGGYKIISKDNNTIIDNSYKAKIKKARNSFISSNFDTNSI